MPELKLPKLPDRTPVKITVSLMPDLNNALQAYADLYREAYGLSETVAELIPYMLQAFLDGDRGFARAAKGRAEATAPSGIPKEQRRPTGLTRTDPTNHR